MSDNYQAVYDAVCSRFSRCNPNDIIAEAARQAFDFSHVKAIMQEEIVITQREQQRPCVLFRPSVKIDGNKWFVLYGENIQDGVAGFGDSVAEAMSDFDSNWYAKLLPRKAKGEQP